MSNRHNEHMSSTRHFENILVLVLLGAVRRHQLAFGKGEVAFSANRNYEVLHQGGIRQAEPAFVWPNLASSSCAVTVHIAGSSVLYDGAVLDIV